MNKPGSKNHLESPTLQCLRCTPGEAVLLHREFRLSHRLSLQFAHISRNAQPFLSPFVDNYLVYVRNDRYLGLSR